MQDQPRRSSPSWDIKDNGELHRARGRGGQALSHVSYENEPGRRTAARVLARDEARRIAANIAKLPRTRGYTFFGHNDGRFWHFPGPPEGIPTCIAIWREADMRDTESVVASCPNSASRSHDAA